MLAIGIGFFVTLIIALAVMVAVALPNLRAGSAILTPTGERATKQVTKQAKVKTVQMVEKVWQLVEKVWRGAVVLSARIARAWQPISARLHEALDRLEAPEPQPVDAQLVDAQPVDAQPVDTQPQVVEPAPVRPVQDRFDVEAVIGRRVGRPRPMPAESGPIPLIPAKKPEQSSAPKSGPETSVIDLREPADTAEPARTARRVQ